MKLFTPNEASDLIPVVRPILQKIQTRHEEIARFREAAKLAAEAAKSGGGGMEGGSRYVKLLYELGKLTLEIDNLGVQLKDYARGLIDFPSWREGRVVLLCWKLGEDDEIRWWHEVEAGFGGRQPL
ncbi:MAG TPA: DUF2203 domain-containing protein [Pyrinomonadaceae bacterium]|nr:DUF2203 domain-containing protein [Pyrinomonadaceae bacterium]